MFVKVKKDSMAKMNSNSKKKEADHLLLNKVANKPLNISDRLHTIVNDIENSLKSKENKISKLAKEVDRTFPPQSISRGLHDAFSAMSFDTAYSLYGFTGFDGRTIMPVLQQRLVKDAIPATPIEIETYMAALGFIKKNNEGRYANGEYEVWDLVPRNVLKDKDGDIFIIDAEIVRR